MPKADRETLRKIQSAFDRYKTEVKESNLKQSTMEPYIRYASYFLRWLDDDYRPGENIRR